MPKLKVIRTTSLHVAASSDAEVIDRIDKDDTVEEIDRRDGFVEVRLKDDFRDLHGFVKATDLAPSDALAAGDPVAVAAGRLTAEAEKAFVQNCAFAAALENDSHPHAPYGVSGDLLLAFSLLVTRSIKDGLTDAGRLFENSDAAGPFQISSEVWGKFLTAGGKVEFQPEDRLDLTFQPRGAAWMAFDATRSVSEAVTAALKAGGLADEDPYIPNSIDVCLYLILGERWGIACILAKNIQEDDTLLVKVLDEPDERRDAVMRLYPDLFGVIGGASLTVGAIYANFETAIDEALEAGTALILKHSPEDVLVSVPATTVEGPKPQNVALPNVDGVDWANATSTLPLKEDKMRSVYVAFRRAGFSDAGARALLAEVGRENDFKVGNLFGSHIDPSNRAVNTGFFSWQKDRATKLLAHLRSKGLIDADQKIQRSQQGLDEQAEFVLKELRQMHLDDLADALMDPTRKLDYDAAAKQLGTKYIKWRFNDPSLSSHHAKRRNYLQLSFQIIGPGAAEASVQPVGSGAIAVTKKGRFHQTQGLKYELAGKTRNKPVSAAFVSQLMAAVAATDPALGVIIISAGQDPIGTPNARRIGSVRHDIKPATGEGDTADLVLVKNGRKIRPPEDRGLYARLLENAAASGFTGLGHYDWGIHVGGGKKAAWGPTTRTASLDPRFGEAIRRGWARKRI